LNEKLIINYEDRLKKNLFELANEPVVIKDFKPYIFNPREDLLHEDEYKILGRHGSVYKGYQNTKERVVSNFIHKFNINLKSNH